MFTSAIEGTSTADPSGPHLAFEPSARQTTFPGSLASVPSRTGLFASTSLAQQQGNARYAPVQKQAELAPIQVDEDLSQSLPLSAESFMDDSYQTQGKVSAQKQAELAPRQVDEDYSQSLPLPAESFIDDSYQPQDYIQDSYHAQSQVDDSYQVQAHVHDSYQTRDRIEDSYQAQGYVSNLYLAQVDKTLKEDNHFQADERAGLTGVIQIAGIQGAVQSRNQVENQSFVEQDLALQSTIRTGSIATEERGPCDHVNHANPAGRGVEVVPDFQTAMGHQSVPESQTTVSVHRPSKDVPAHANGHGPREGSSADSQHKTSIRSGHQQEEHAGVSQRRITATSHEMRRDDSVVQSASNGSGQVAVINEAPDDAAHRAVNGAIQRSLSSRSVRVLPSRKKNVSLHSTSQLLNSNQDASGIVVPDPREPIRRNVDAETVVHTAAASATISQLAPQPTVIQAGKIILPIRELAGNTVVKALPESGKFKKKTHNSMKQQAIGGSKDQITSNARYQTRISQSIGRPGMTPEELQAARDAAKPPQAGDCLEGAVFQPIVTPTKKQRDKALDALLTRASISSPSGQTKTRGHPRAAQVQARQAQRDAVSTTRPTSRLGSSHDGINDEKAAIDLMFKAREREAEINRLRKQVETLLEQAAVLRKEKIQLITKNEETLSKNEQALKKQKEAVARARDIVTRSDAM